MRTILSGSRANRLVPAAVATLILTSCFGAATIQRSYYVLHGVTVTARDGAGPARGLLRVRNLDAASIYEKFQIVMRRSPFELTYSENNVWAVKPNRMISDVIAQGLTDARAFASITRELGEIRADYVMSGDLGAIEVFDSGDLWYAHLAISLSITRAKDGQTVHSYKFDERKPVPLRSFSQAARAISELLSTALDELIAGLDTMDVPRELSPISVPTGAIAPPVARPPAPTATAEPVAPPAVQEPEPEPEPEDSDTIFVPERR